MAKRYVVNEWNEKELTIPTRLKILKIKIKKCKKKPACRRKLTRLMKEKA